MGPQCELSQPLWITNGIRPSSSSALLTPQNRQPLAVLPLNDRLGRQPNPTWKVGNVPQCRGQEVTCQSRSNTPYSGALHTPCHASIVHNPLLRHAREFSCPTPMGSQMVGRQGSVKTSNCRSLQWTEAPQAHTRTHMQHNTGLGRSGELAWHQTSETHESMAHHAWLLKWRWHVPPSLPNAPLAQ